MKILVIRGDGLISFHLIQALLSRVDKVVNIANLNHYRNLQLKLDRLAKIAKYPRAAHYQFTEIDIANRPAVAKLFARHQFDVWSTLLPKQV